MYNVTQYQQNLVKFEIVSSTKLAEVLLASLFINLNFHIQNIPAYSLLQVMVRIYHMNSFGTGEKASKVI